MTLIASSMPDVPSSCAPMKFSEAIDRYLADMRIAGRINSDSSEVAYRRCLELHGEDVDNRDPSKTGREDCKKTLSRWAHPNTQRKNRSMLISFYDWAMEEGYRTSNPARMTRRPKKRPTTVYRLTREEAAAMLHAAQGPIERRAIYLGLCAGLRNAELRGLRGWHLDRRGLVQVSADIAKGGKERWIPVLEELEPIVEEIRAHVSSEHYVLPGLVNTNPPLSTIWRPVPTRAMSAQTVWRMVADVAQRAGIQAHVHPHLLRHAYGDFIARSTDIKVAQQMLGHSSISTTENYVGTPSLEKLIEAVEGLRYEGQNQAEITDVETVGIEPTASDSRSIEPNLDGEAIQ